MLGFATLEAAADLNRITSVPWLRSWKLREVVFLLDLRSMAAGVVACHCTQSLGLELGRCYFSFLKAPQDYSHCCVFQDSLPYLFLGPVVTTGRSWSPPLAAPSAPPWPHLIDGESPKATLTWCSKRRLPPRSSWRLCLTRPAKATELLSEAFDEEKQRGGVRRHTHTFPKVYVPKKIEMLKFFLF